MLRTPVRRLCFLLFAFTSLAVVGAWPDVILHSLSHTGFLLRSEIAR